MNNEAERDYNPNDESDDDGVIEGEVKQPDIPPRWTPVAGTPVEYVFVETGRGEPVQVRVGELFRNKIETLAEQAHYGGFFRVFVNGQEILEPDAAEAQMKGLPVPPTYFEPGMRVVITPYDKVGQSGLL
jgi:hypothetical protein